MKSALFSAVLKKITLLLLLGEMNFSALIKAESAVFRDYQVMFRAGHR